MRREIELSSLSVMSRRDLNGNALELLKSTASLAAIPLFQIVIISLSSSSKNAKLGAGMPSCVNVRIDGQAAMLGIGENVWVSDMHVTSERKIKKRNIGYILALIYKFALTVSNIAWDIGDASDKATSERCGRHPISENSDMRVSETGDKERSATYTRVSLWLIS